MDNLRETEIKFQNELELISKEKETCLGQITSLNKDLKQKEHQYCMRIWGTVEYERSTRKLLEIVSLKLIDVKDTLTDAHKKVFFFGEGHMRYYNGFVVKTSKRVNIRVTGTALQLGYLSQEKDTSSKTRSRIIPIDTIDEIEVTREVNSVPLRKSSDGRSPSNNRVSFTVRESELQYATVSPTSHTPEEKGKVYFIFRFRNHPTPSASDEMSGESKANLSPILGVPMRTPPPPHPIVLCLDDSWGEIVDVPAQPEKVKEKGLFARAKAKLSGKSTSPAVVATPSPPTVIYRAKSLAHQFFEALQCASVPDTHFLGCDHFSNRQRESQSDRHFPYSSSPLVNGDLKGIDWNSSNINPSQLSGYGTSGLTSVESLLSTSHRTSSSYHTSRSSQSGSRMSFATTERDSLQSIDTLARSLPKNLPDIAETNEFVLQKKKSFSSYQPSRSTLPLGRVVEERDDRSTSNDSSSLSHGSSQLLGLVTTPEQFHDCVRLQQKEFSQPPLLEDDEDHHDHEDWKSVGSHKETNEEDEEEYSRQYSVDSAEKLVSITIDDDRPSAKPKSAPSLLALSLQSSKPPPTPSKNEHSSRNLASIPQVNELKNAPIESYSCPATNYMPSAIEGYGPITAPSPLSSPIRSSRLPQQHFPRSSSSELVSSESNQFPSEVAKSNELSSSLPVESVLLRHMTSRVDVSTSLSLFGESMTVGSFQDSEYLAPLSLDPHFQSAQSDCSAKPNSVSFKIPPDISESDDRLSCCSLPNPPRPQTEGHFLDRSRKGGHSFSHAEEVKKGSPSKVNFDRPLLSTETPRHVAYTLTLEMNSIRDQRKDLEESLISCITERENLLQTLHYLQSLRNALKHPPSAPSEKYSPANTSSRALRKRFSTLSIIRSSRESSGEMSTESMSSHPDRNISQLSALLSAAVSSGMVEPSTTAESSNTEQTTSSSRKISNDSVSREDEKNARKTSTTEAEEFVYNLLNTTSSTSAAIGDVKSSGRIGHSDDKSKKVDGQQSRPILSLSLSQLIGPPPAALTKEYER